MNIPVVDALLGAFGPFVIPVLVFAAGVVGYGVLFFAGRVLSAEGATGWATEDDEEPPDPDPDPDRRDG
jgi:hypothetical protein